MRAATILHTIGDTPHIRVNRLFGNGHEVWIKSERANPGGSIKDRIGLAMIEDAEKSGRLQPGAGQHAGGASGLGGGVPRGASTTGGKPPLSTRLSTASRA